VSGDKRYVLARVPAGTGRALDLGGGSGMLSDPLRSRGYAYVNVDISPRGPFAVAGDAQRLPFPDGSFEIVVSADSLEHFPDPRTAIGEIRRVLTPTGKLVLWVPFLHPFHGDDLWRYTPLGLRTLFEGGGLEIVSLEAPLWVASVIAQALVILLVRSGLGSLEGPLERAAAWVDSKLERFQGPNLSFAAAYLIVARPVSRAR
jgi:SAM-dependent methyltransferase